MDAERTSSGPVITPPADDLTTCSIEGCDGEIRSRGWCSTHYARWYRTGDPLALKGHQASRKPAGMFSSFEVCDAAGITYRQLNHWIRRGLIEGQGPLSSGVPRWWTPEQRERVCQIKRGLQKVDEVIEEYGLRHFAVMARTDAAVGT